MDRQSICAEYRRLSDAQNYLTKVTKARRGYDFERFLYALLDHEGLEPSTSYRPDGEEIDGSFILDGRFFLLEAKWRDDPMPASAVYAFKGKVDGKFSGTVGLFISMSGYSPDTVGAVVRGKELNILIFDSEDIETALSESSSFKQVLRDRLRAAAQKGIVYRNQNIEDYSYWEPKESVDSFLIEPGIKIYADQIVRQDICTCDRQYCVGHQEKVLCTFPVWLSEWVITKGIYWQCYDELVECPRCFLLHIRGHIGRIGVCKVPYLDQRRQSDVV
jgi:hypothetical protein